MQTQRSESLNCIGNYQEIQVAMCKDLQDLFLSRTNSVVEHYINYDVIHRNHIHINTHINTIFFYWYRYHAKGYSGFLWRWGGWANGGKWGDFLIHLIFIFMIVN